MNRSNISKTETLYLHRHQTPLGIMVSGCSDKALHLLEYGNHKWLNTYLAQLRVNFGDFRQVPNKLSQLMDAQLQEYFCNKRKEFDIPLCFNGTDFQKQAWTALCDIPYGTTISYREQAERCGCPRAVRAVANADGKNKLSIIVPCHRVIGSNGKLTGYAGRLWRKKKLLALEKQCR